MDWDDAKYFLAIAREGQMLGAARRLNVSQALLSRRLQSLESAVGARLFDRSTRGCQLTDDGRLFLDTAERVEAELVSGLSRLGLAEAEIAGTVRVGAPDGLGGAFIAPRLGALAASFPKLRVQLAPLTHNFSLSQREADIAIMIGRPAKGRLRVKRLLDYTLSVYAARSYLETAGAPTQPEDLAQHRLVGYVEDLLHSPELNYTEEFWPGWRSDIEISTAIGQLEAVRGGAGIGALHDFMAIDDPSLVRLFPERTVTRSYWAVWHENLASSRKIAIVVDFLEREMRRENERFNRSSTKA
ncbi:MAG: LysR family transcriptional regulator [Rhodobacteraceae bacterium]|nr:LysR family transcriptional regulator [Paracoccaceae bacterium]